MSGLTQIVGSTAGVAYVASVNSSGKMNVEDSQVYSALTSTLTVADSAVLSQLQGTLSVSSPAIFTTNSLLKSAQTVADTITETTSSTDLGGVRRCAVFGSLDDTAGSIGVEVSADSTTWYENPEVSIFINSNNEFYNTIEIDSQYIRFSYTNSSGSSKTWSCNISYKN